MKAGDHRVALGGINYSQTHTHTHTLLGYTHSWDEWVHRELADA